MTTPNDKCPYCDEPEIASDGRSTSLLKRYACETALYAVQHRPDEFFRSLVCYKNEVAALKAKLERTQEVMAELVHDLRDDLSAECESRVDALIEHETKGYRDWQERQWELHREIIKLKEKLRTIAKKEFRKGVEWEMKERRSIHD